MIETVPSIKRDYIQQLAADGRRVDGRESGQMRRLEVRRASISSAEGAAEVILGATRVIVGVKISPGEPFPDSPKNGVLVTSAELRPIASPSFSPGFPSEESIEVARVVDRGIRESGTLDMERLCIDAGKLVWVVNIDIHVLDCDGNLFDAGGIGAIAALKSAKLPASGPDGEDVGRPLPTRNTPVPATCVKIGKSLLADPTRDEESVADMRLTITATEDGNICAVQKGLMGSIKIGELEACIDMAQKNGESVRMALKKV